MAVVYSPRNFPSHEGGYPSMGESESADNATTRYASPPDMDRLSRFTASAPTLTEERSLLPEERALLEDDRTLLTDDAVSPAQATTLDLPTTIDSLLPTTGDDTMTGKNASSPQGSSRGKGVPKPDRDVKKQPDGKFYCEFVGCTEDIKKFSRKCEWSKHMDKHERPYRCAAEGCEKLPGFTYSGGLLRHEREVHNKHGGPKKTLNCPYNNCKRNSGKGFSRQENLNEHLRRVHTNDSAPAKAGSVGSAGSDAGAADAPTITAAGAVADEIASTDNDTDYIGPKKRKRIATRGDGDGEKDELHELREEIKRVCRENEILKKRMEQQDEHQLAMVAQIAHLQESLRMHSLVTETATTAAPTASMM